MNRFKQTCDSCFMFPRLVQLGYSVSGLTNKVVVGCRIDFALVPKTSFNINTPAELWDTRI